MQFWSEKAEAEVINTSPSDFAPNWLQTHDEHCHAGEHVTGAHLGVPRRARERPGVLGVVTAPARCVPGGYGGPCCRS